MLQNVKTKLGYIHGQLNMTVHIVKKKSSTWRNANPNNDSASFRNDFRNNIHPSSRYEWNTLKKKKCDYFGLSYFIEMYKPSSNHDRCWRVAARFGTLFRNFALQVPGQEHGIWTTSRENLSSRFAREVDSNRPAQLQKPARLLKFRL